MLVNLQTVIGMAEAGGFCVPAFNVYNTETLMGVIAAAEEAHAPVIVQVYPRLIKEEVGFYICPAAVAAAGRASVPVCLHLDHGPDLFSVQRSLRWGMTGIMLDGSTHPLEENIALTRQVVELCAAVGVGVEGEIGHVGSVNDAAMDEFTSPDEAAEFVRQTGVTCLAVLIGNAHGHYKKPPKLDIQRTADIAAATGIPLVLHGGSGIPDDQIRAAVKAGICKVNYATDLCYAFMDTLAAQIDTRPALDLFMKKPIEAVQAFAENRIELVGAAGKV